MPSLEKFGNLADYPQSGDFTALLNWHLDHGTRASGKARNWSNQEFAKEIGLLDERSVRNWRAGRVGKINSYSEIEDVLFNDSTEHQRFRTDLFVAYQQHLRSHATDTTRSSQNQLGASGAVAELRRLNTTHLLCIDEAVELYRGNDLVSNSQIKVKQIASYDPKHFEFDSLTSEQCLDLANTWPEPVANYLRTRVEKEGKNESQCKVNFCGLDISPRGLGHPPSISVRPVTYWVIAQFNKEIASGTNPSLKTLRQRYAKEIFTGTSDFKCSCPSALYLELALITSDGLVPVMTKNPRQSALSIRAFKLGQRQIAGVKTCGPEFGFVWAKHIKSTGAGPVLDVQSAIHDGLLDEFRILPSEVTAWRVNSFAIQSVHLNSSLLGTVQLGISGAEFKSRVAKLERYHFPEVAFLRLDQLQGTIEEDHGKNLWHSSALLRLDLAKRMLAD